MLQKDIPDHHDAELVIRLYELRREPLMRESRAAITKQYLPRSAAEAIEVLRADHQLNAAFRQVATYCEMVFGMAHHGIVQADYLIENSGEGMLVFARVQPWLDAIRTEGPPHYFVHAEWAAGSTDAGRRLFEYHRARLAKTLAAHAS